MSNKHQRSIINHSLCSSLSWGHVWLWWLSHRNTYVLFPLEFCLFELTKLLQVFLEHRLLHLAIISLCDLRKYMGASKLGSIIFFTPSADHLGRSTNISKWSEIYRCSKILLHVTATDNLGSASHGALNSPSTPSMEVAQQPNQNMPIVQSALPSWFRSLCYLPIITSCSLALSNMSSAWTQRFFRTLEASYWFR